MTSTLPLQHDLPQASPGDADIARCVQTALARSAFAPKTGIQASVHAGWVTLAGVVAQRYQKQVAEETVRFVDGVTGVSNQLAILPPGARDTA